MSLFKSIIKNTLYVAVKNSQTIKYGSRFTCRRYLFSVESLGVTALESKKEISIKNVKNQDEFKSKMEEYCNMPSTFLIFSDDLMKMLKIAQTDKDLNLFIKMMKRFREQNSSVLFHQFNYGPEIMRLYYILNKPNEALELLRDEEMSWIFQNYSSYIILADLCFKKEMYNEVIEVFSIYEEKQFLSRRYIDSLNTLFFASCYKLNSEESFQKASDLWKKFLDIGKRIHYKDTAFLAKLALNLDKSHLALNFLTFNKENPVSNNLKIMAFAKEKRIKEAFEILSDVLFSDKPYFALRNNFISIETLECIKDNISSDDEVSIKKLQKFEAELKIHLLLKEKPLDHFLCEKLEYKKLKDNTKFVMKM